MLQTINKQRDFPPNNQQQRPNKYYINKKSKKLQKNKNSPENSGADFNLRSIKETGVLQIHFFTASVSS